MIPSRCLPSIVCVFSVIEDSLCCRLIARTNSATVAEHCTNQLVPGQGMNTCALPCVSDGGRADFDDVGLPAALRAPLSVT
jgi:hypothetical protein